MKIPSLLESNTQIMEKLMLYNSIKILCASFYGYCIVATKATHSPSLHLFNGATLYKSHEKHFKFSILFKGAFQKF